MAGLTAALVLPPPGPRTARQHSTARGGHARHIAPELSAGATVLTEVFSFGCVLAVLTGRVLCEERGFGLGETGAQGWRHYGAAATIRSNRHIAQLAARSRYKQKRFSPFVHIPILPPSIVMRPQPRGLDRDPLPNP